MKIFLKIIEWVLNIASTISGYAALLMGVFVFYEVIMRYTGNAVRGDSEIICYMLLVVMFLAFGYCSLHNGHIVMDILRAFPWLDHVWAVCEMVAMLAFAYMCYSQHAMSAKMHISTAILNIPRAPLDALTAVGFVLVFFGTLGYELKYFYQKHLEKQQKKQIASAE